MKHARRFQLLCDLGWRRDGADWVLLHKRRRMGRVTPDKQYPGMYRIVLSRGRRSDMANLSWAKNAVLEAATRELEYEAHHRQVITPPKPQQLASVFESASPLVSYSRTVGSSLPSSI